MACGGWLQSGLCFALPALLTATERDPLQPRVPKQELEAAKAMTNPFPATPENIAKGDGLYHGKGTCFVCHGQTGVGDGSAAVGLDPSPRNFTNAAFHRARTDGELMWVLKHGSAGTAMVPLVGSVIDEDELAHFAVRTKPQSGVVNRRRAVNIRFRVSGRRGNTGARDGERRLTGGARW
jgi:mono/diheme cytochrome c family protein